MTDTRLLPNLLIPGVTKAGTTSLFWYLAQHPDICPASVKEIDYFAPLRYSEPLESSLEDYTRHFSHCAGERYRLDASPTSFYGGPELTQAVARTLPDVKIVIALRDPVDRFWSGYRYKKLKGGLDESVDFRAFFERCLRLREAGEDARKENALYRALSIGRYVDSLPDWFDVFDARVRLIFFEDLAVSPQPAVAGLCRWLGIDDTPTHRFDYGVSNKTLKPRSRLLHRGARWINRSADRLLHVNSHRRVKGLLRDAYHRLNASSHTETFSAEDRRLVQDFYAGANELLAKELSERGYRNLPRWLAIPTTP